MKNYFQKILDLQAKNPRMGMSNAWSTNSDYTVYCAYNKNCYLLIGSERDEECLYGIWIYESRDCNAPRRKLRETFSFHH